MIFKYEIKILKTVKSSFQDLVSWWKLWGLNYEDFIVSRKLHQKQALLVCKTADFGISQSYFSNLSEHNCGQNCGRAFADYWFRPYLL